MNEGKAGFRDEHYLCLNRAMNYHTTNSFTVSSDYDRA